MNIKAVLKLTTILSDAGNSDLFFEAFFPTREKVITSIFKTILDLGFDNDEASTWAILLSSSRLTAQELVNLSDGIRKAKDKLDHVGLSNMIYSLAMPSRPTGAELKSVTAQKMMTMSKYLEVN